MRGWNELPTELKRKCVEHMDLITRFQFQACSLASYNLFRSIRTEYPRVRFGEKQKRYLLLIYTDVAKFLRLEFCKENEETVVYRSVDTLENPQRKVLPYPDHYELAVLTLKSLVLRPNVTVDTFQWNIAKGEKNHARFKKIVGGARLRVRTVSYRGVKRINTNREVHRFIGVPRHINLREPRQIEAGDVPSIHLLFQINGGKIAETLFVDYTEQTCLDRLRKSTPAIKLRVLLAAMESTPSEGIWSVTAAFVIFSKEDEKAIFDEIPGEATRSNGVDVKCGTLIENPEFYNYFKYSPLCGLSVTMVVHDAHQLKRQNFETCIKGLSCQHHRSRFEQWFMQQPPRCLNGPFWCEYEEEEEDEEEEEEEKEEEEEEKEEEEKEKEEEDEEEDTSYLKLLFIISVLVAILAFRAFHLSK